MIDIGGTKKNGRLLSLLLVLLLSGCGISSSYRSAEQKTIRDFSGSSKYRKIGVLVLSNATMFVAVHRWRHRL
jgi:ABC-type Fe3+-citrate transport system substrate-binding protein